MKKTLTLLTALTTTSLFAGFEFNTCSGSGTFEQEILFYAANYENAATVGEIPEGIEGLKINLISNKDVDIRLYGENNDKVVHWPYGILNEATQETQTYQGVDITYSGYNGVNEALGHEYIEINGTTPTTLTMKAFGFRAGYATVNYSWTGKEGCTPTTSGEGHFTQTLEQNLTSLVGTIPPGVNNVMIELLSDKDIDIQLYGQDGTAIASWKPTGLMAGATEQSIIYHDMNVTWSGYNGTDNEKGHEFIKISNMTSEMLIMKVYGYEAGSMQVDYSWGNDNDSNFINVSGTIFDTNNQPISNAIVNIDNETQITNANGIYSFSNVEKNNRIVVNVSHSNYLKNSKVLVDINDNALLDITLHRPNETITFNSEEGTSLVQADGATLILPPSSYINRQSNIAYTGQIIAKMSYYPITTFSGKSAFPGTYETQNMMNQTTSTLQSHGFMNIQLTDLNGTVLDLDGNDTAILFYPYDYKIGSNDMVPLYSYDEKSGYWIQEGESILDEEFDTYIMATSHVGFFNIGTPDQEGSFSGCVQDEEGVNLDNVNIEFISASWNSYLTQTNSSGEFSIHNVITSSPITLSAHKEIDNTLFYGEKIINLSENENRTDESCIILHSQGEYTLNTATINGTISTSDINQTTGEEISIPFANQLMTIYDTRTYAIVDEFYTDDNGSFSHTFERTDAIFYSIDNMMDIELKTHKKLYNIGDITL